ncbi:cupin domain-containing protein [Pseudohoeflea coraliihabitans]|uniref:Cupin domain-containing protein n=1 Tax=Pseudohoeflea coraliihabitans TaxID=2860393 RepID=A0ABS6WRD0_9HYPH|nr:cupin domain-containing protein [Pseudohoeflea sp. DP4N28-3]MBW3098524.1 cupin domain-containing protein [Pseudohoeflea sp. DP4N28-3]
MNQYSLGADAFEWLGVQYRPLLRTKDSGGAISITESLAPAGSGPPRHVHHDADETLSILTGSIEVWHEGERSVVHAGEAVFIPRGREHTFRVTSEGPARHLIILTPGGFEGFFAEMAAGQFAIPDDMPAIIESGERHQLSFTGPPLADDPPLAIASEG